MIAYAPGRRRTARSIAKKWGLIFLALTVVASVVAAIAVIASDIRPAEPAVIVIAPTPPVTPTPYRPEGPDVTLPSMYAVPVEISRGPRTASPVMLHLGPNENYVVLGTLQAGASLEVVGRDDSAEWLAVEFPPNSTFRAWLPASLVLDVEDIGALPLEPVRFLP